ncbi:MAG: topoisomerase C-terminal repeat-containing protein, partial [Paracoccaceae bacterium]|nr:topoisomerase C-terminal repeat-containing protein [Paracoccaceae bacterium]
ANAIPPEGQALGQDENGLPISLRSGRFGPYVQRGEATDDAPKPPRASLPKGWAPESITLERALTLLNLPRQIGPHPEDGEMIEAAIGRYGPYVKHGKTYANLPDVDEVFTIGMNRAVEVLAQKFTRGRGAAAPAGPIKELGEHPDGGIISVMPGRYGPYVKWGKINATLPKEITPEAVTLDEALALVAEKAAKGGKAKKAPAKKPAAKAAPKKTAAKATGAKSPAKPKAAAKTAPKAKAAAKPKPAAKPKAAPDEIDLLE